MTFSLQKSTLGIAPVLFGVLKRHAGIGPRLVLQGATADHPAYIECRRCQTSRLLPSLIDTREFEGIARAFIAAHARCRKVSA